tara:strand:- start:7344 stop:7856 length:513 start_codon:yes stop_codon:yes gene_type:complete
MENPYKPINDKLNKLLYLFDELLNNSSNVPIEPDLLDVKQASEFLKQAEGTLYNNALKGTIPSYKKFGKRYFLKSELLEWIKEGKHKTRVQIAEDVNQTLSEQKKGQRSKEPLDTPSKEQGTDTDNSHSEKQKATLDTFESQGENIEDATEETGQLHYLQNEGNLDLEEK